MTGTYEAFVRKYHPQGYRIERAQVPLDFDGGAA